MQLDVQGKSLDDLTEEKRSLQNRIDQIDTYLAGPSRNVEAQPTRGNLIARRERTGLLAQIRIIEIEIERRQSEITAHDRLRQVNFELKMNDTIRERLQQEEETASNIGEINDIYEEYANLLKDDARLNKKKQEIQDEIMAERLTSVRKDINNNRMETSTKTEEGISRRKELLSNQLTLRRMETRDHGNEGKEWQCRYPALGVNQRVRCPFRTRIRQNRIRHEQRMHVRDELFDLNDLE